MHGHGAAVVVDVVAALTVGEDLDALDEAGWVRSGRRKRVGGVSVSDSEGDFDRLRIDKGRATSQRDATRIDEDHHAFSIAQPWPKPSQPQENTRAIAQLEQCAQIPAMRLPCMKAARVGGVAKAWYLDDQSQVCCALPCASSMPLVEDTHYCLALCVTAQLSFRRAAQCALCMFLFHTHCPWYALALFATHRLTRAACAVRWPSLRPLRMQQTQENGLALLYSALTLRTHNNSTAAQVHHEPSGQHLRCIACAYAAISTGAALGSMPYRNKQFSGKSIFILPRWPFR